MASRKDVEEIRSDSGSKGLATLARMLGYHERNGQLDMGAENGATASDLFAFLDDNPGAVEAVLMWVLDEGCHRDGSPLEEEEIEEDDDSEKEEEA